MVLYNTSDSCVSALAFICRYQLNNFFTFDCNFSLWLNCAKCGFEWNITSMNMKSGSDILPLRWSRRHLEHHQQDNIGIGTNVSTLRWAPTCTRARCINQHVRKRIKLICMEKHVFVKEKDASLTFNCKMFDILVTMNTPNKSCILNIRSISMVICSYCKATVLDCFPFSLRDVWRCFSEVTALTQSTQQHCNQFLFLFLFLGAVVTLRSVVVNVRSAVHHGIQNVSQECWLMLICER